MRLQAAQIATGSGRHRRPRPSQTRRLLATAGLAGIALPLATATHASAATPTSGSVSPAAATHSATAAALPAAPANNNSAPAARTAATTTYTVQSGDWLSSIAQSQHVSGGWQRLYDLNRVAIGNDPDLILPGQRLALGEAAAAPAATTKPTATPRTDNTATSASPATAPKATATGYVVPVTGFRISTEYGVAGPWAAGHHTGIDLAVPTGTEVRAAGGGTVVTSGWGGAYGNNVIIRHTDGTYSLYAHMSALEVSAGETVTSGQRIGLSGSTGNSTGPHLHFEIRTAPTYGSDINPVAWLAARGVTLS